MFYLYLNFNYFILNFLKILFFCCSIFLRCLFLEEKKISIELCMSLFKNQRWFNFYLICKYFKKKLVYKNKFEKKNSLFKSFNDRQINFCSIKTTFHMVFPHPMGYKLYALSFSSGRIMGLAHEPRIQFLRNFIGSVIGL